MFPVRLRQEHVVRGSWRIPGKTVARPGSSPRMKTTLRAALGAALPFTFAFAMPAQDAIGVLFTGEIVRLDTTTGAVTQLATGTPGKNALTFDNDNRLWTSVRPNSTQTVWRLARIDPVSGTETLPFPSVNVGDVRAMCIARSLGGLYAIREATPTDELIHIDTDTGVVTSIGFTNHAAIQGLEDPFGGGKAWDVNAGRLNINLQTGVTSDPSISAVDPAGLQFMCRNPETNEVFVGRGSLYRLNTTNSTTTLVVNFAGNPDVRGMEFTLSRRENFGGSCPAQGGPFLSPQLPILAGGTMTATANNMATGTIGALIVGFSEDSYQGLALPLLLDPLLGTTGCSLHVSADILFAGVANQGLLTIGVPLPASIGLQQFYLQAVGLTGQPGGFTFSQGVRVRPRL